MKMHNFEIDVLCDSRRSPVLIDTAVRAILEEFGQATQRYRPFASRQEAAAVLLKEVDEFWDEIKQNNAVGARAEAIQIAATALRFLVEVNSDGV